MPDEHSWPYPAANIQVRKDLPPGEFLWLDGEGKKVICIKADGKIEWYGTKSEAAKVFWEAIEEFNPLRLRNKALQKNIQVLARRVHELECKLRDAGIDP
jgi:hypothetical protein